jgi:predicted amidohydrolase
MMKIGVVQMSLSEVLQKNLQKIHDFVNEALNKEIVVLAFPETALTGYIYKGFHDVDYSEVESSLANIQTSLRGSTLCVIVGTPMKIDGHVFNSAVVLFPDGKRTVYHKVFLTDYEQEYFEHGEKELTFEHLNTTFGILVCRDQNSPEHARKLKKKGAAAMFICSAHYYNLRESKLKLEKNTALPVARAYENNVYVCKSNVVGTTQGKISYGNSMIVDPNGIVVLRGDEISEKLLWYDAQLDIENKQW